MAGIRITRTLSVYIARQFLTWCGVVFGAILLIVFLLDYIELIRRARLKADVPLSLLLEMAALKLPHMAQEILPFGVLFGTMLAFWRLTRSNELVVARAAGVSVWQFLLPAILAALTIGIFAVAVFNPVASKMQRRYEMLENQLFRNTGGLSELGPTGLWLRQADLSGLHALVHAERIAPGGLVLENVTFLFFGEDDLFTGRIDTAEARLEPGHWVLAKGMKWNREGIGEPFTRLDLKTNLTGSKIQESFTPPEAMSFWELPDYIHLLQVSGFPAQRHQLYWNALLARPLLLSSMVLVAAAFSLRMQRRGGTTLMIIGGMSAGFLLFFLSNVVFALGLSTTIPVALAAWTPAGISLLLGTSFLFHLEDG